MSLRLRLHSMNLEHLIQQLQEAHAKLGNHAAVELEIRGYGLDGFRQDYAVQSDDIKLDAAKQMVYLPVTVREQH